MRQSYLSGYGQLFFALGTSPPSFLTLYCAGLWHMVWPKPLDHSHLYIATGQSLETQSLQNLKKQFCRLDFFCINDTTDDAHDGDPRLLQVREMLNALLPNSSQNEMASSQDGNAVQALKFKQPLGMAV